MSINSAGKDVPQNSGPSFPDYELEERVVVTQPEELKAMAHPVRSALLELVLERAATVSELAAALGRPKSTVAHHVKVLVDAGMFKVVRTRRVRAIDERFYGRTARLLFIGQVRPEDVDPPPWPHPFLVAAAESEAAYRADTMWANGRHSRITRASAREFWPRVEALLREFSQLPREGEEVFALTIGLYPTEFPSLPEVDEPQQG